jgi:hypothetical protein
VFLEYGKREFAVPLHPVPVANKIAILIVCAVCLFVSWVSVLLRLWTRAFISRSLGLDDWIMVLTTVSNRLRKLDRILTSDRYSSRCFAAL